MLSRMKTYTLETLRSELGRLLSQGTLTQQDVSAATGVVQSAISMFVTGKRGLHGDAALRIESFLRVRKKGVKIDDAN